MPDRYIREKARSSPTLQALCDAAERAWWRLTTTADDYGRFDADPEVLLAELFKRKPHGWTARKMTAVIEEWESVGLIHRYTSVGNGARDYAHVLTWAEHQRARDSKPKFPDPPCGNLPQSAAKCGESRLARGPVRAGASESVSESENSKREASSTGSWPSPAALVALYNELGPDEAPAVVTTSPGRQAKIRRYLRDFPDEAWWREVFAQMRRSRFLRGLVTRKDQKPFVADLDWLLTKGKDGTENAVKTHDGRYQDA